MRLSLALRKDGAQLPRLPPRSFFRKRLLPGFMESRRQGLSAFLGAAVARDPFCTSEHLREFLGLSCLSASSACGKVLHEASDDGDDDSTVATNSVKTDGRLPPILEQPGFRSHASDASDFL